jgi:hypothetical protein
MVSPTRSRARSTLLAINVGADCSFPIAQVRVEIDCLQASGNQDASRYARSELPQTTSFRPRLMRPELGVGELDGWRQMENPSPKVPAADVAHWRTGSSASPGGSGFAGSVVSQRR